MLYEVITEAPKALFMIGFIQANELFQYAEAKRTFNSFIETYPKHELAYSAEMELQNIGKSPEEVFRTNSLKAVEEYEKVYKNYPNSAEAPKALFMIGFIQANRNNFV